MHQSGRRRGLRCLVHSRTLPPIGSAAAPSPVPTQDHARVHFAGMVTTLLLSNKVNDIIVDTITCLIRRLKFVTVLNKSIVPICA